MWLLGWFLGELIAIDTLFFNNSYFNFETNIEDADNLFLIVWLFFWSIGGVHAVIYLAWMLFGEEEVIIESKQISITRILAFFSRSKYFENELIVNFRIKIEKDTNYSRRKKANSFLSNYGSLRFNYKGKEVKFGLDLSRTDSELVYNSIKEISRFTNLNLKLE